MFEYSLYRSFDDLAVYLNILKGEVDNMDSTSVQIECDNGQYLESDEFIKDIVIGIPQEFYCEDMSNEVIETWSQVADLLEKERIKVVPVSLPHTKYSISCYQVSSIYIVVLNLNFKYLSHMSGEGFKYLWKNTVLKKLLL